MTWFDSNVTEHDTAQAILMVEDEPADAELFSYMLSVAFKNRYPVVCLNQFKEVTETLDSGDFQALVLDMNLPDSSGVSKVRSIGEAFPELPIIVLTGEGDNNLAIDSLKHGAQDYLSKNKVTPDILANSIRYAKERKKIEQKLKLAIADADSKNRQLDALSKKDSLTGLPNRAHFRQVALNNIKSANRHERYVGLLYFDLNGFKKINDTYSHLAGDQLLKLVTQRLQKVVRASDFLARIGGDEFVIVTEPLTHKQDIYPLVKRVHQQFEQSFDIEGRVVHTSSSVGVAFYPDAESLDALIKLADSAMYEAKKSSNAATCFYSEQTAAHYLRLQKIESNLVNAIEQQELNAIFQPVLSVQHRETIHLEALARWESATLGAVAPDEFIPVAENSLLINRITQSVTQHSGDLFKLMQHPTGRVSINVSARQLTSDTFCELFMGWLQERGLQPNQVCLELTERQMVNNVEACKRQINFLRKQGIQLALDDYGSGFSSVTHLLELPFDILKLDRMLIKQIDKNLRNQALVAGIVEMAHRLNMKVVAEGIEREQEMQYAIDLGCDYLQGFFISKPLPANETAEFYEAAAI